MDLNALLSTYGTSNETAIETALGRIVGVSHDAAEDKSRQRVATRHLLEAVADVVQQMILNSYTSAGHDAIVRRDPLAVGGGVARSTELDTLQGYVEQLKALPEPQRQGVGIAIGQLLDGTTKVIDANGTLELEQAKSDTEVELNAAKRTLATLEPLKTAAIKLATIRDDIEREGRVKAIEAIAMRRVDVMPDGSLPSADATLTAANTQLKNDKLALENDKTALTTKVAELQAIVDAIKDKGVYKKAALGRPESISFTKDAVGDTAWGAVKK